VNASFQKEKLIVVFTVLVDVIGFGIVIPILPFYVQSFGASAFTITLLFSTFALFAFVSAPFLGALSDRIGRRPILLLSIASTAIGWYIFASAPSILFLFLGRIIDGSAAGNFAVAQSSLVDLSRDEKERATNLGLIGASFGLGFMIGPVIGGALSTVSHSFPFYFTGMLATVNVILAFFFLPETNKKIDPQAVISFNPLSPLRRAALNVPLRPFFFRWILFAISFFLSQSIFALFAEGVFGFNSLTTGVLFTIIGVTMILNQGILLKYVWLRYFSEVRLESIMLVVMAVSLGLMGSKILLLFYVGIATMAVSQSLLRIVITSRVAGAAPPRMKGEVIGMMSSLMAGSMVVAPVVGGALFELEPSYPYAAAVVLMAVAAWSAFRGASRNHTPPNS